MKAFKPSELGRLLGDPENAAIVGGYNVDFAIKYPHPLPDAEPIEDTKAGFAMERQLQQLCQGYLAQKGIWYHHLSTRSRESGGMPDILCVLPPNRPVAVELKSQSGKLSRKQVEVMTRMSSNGWEVYVVRTWESWLGVFDRTTKEWKENDRC